MEYCYIEDATDKCINKNLYKPLEMALLITFLSVRIFQLRTVTFKFVLRFSLGLFCHGILDKL